MPAPPAAHARQGEGAAAIRFVFSQPLAPDSPLPTLSPSIAGTWRASGNSIEFVPRLGFPQLTHVKLVIPGGPSGVRSADGGAPAPPAGCPAGAGPPASPLHI